MFKRAVTSHIVFITVLGILLFIYIRYSAPSAHTGDTIVINASSSAPLVFGQTSGSKASSYTPAFINPEAVANLDRHYIINFAPLRRDLLSIKDSQKQKTYIYFAYLNNNSWIGLDEKEMFTAASTIKVPLAMSIYKMEEAGKIRSSDSYTLTDLDLDQNFGSLYKVGADNSFTIEELVRIMLVYSDNTAMQGLFKVMKLIGVNDPLSDVYGAMGWEYNDFGTAPSYININLKTLSTMFVALYNATYISVVDSQKVLFYLSQSEFKEQIVAGLPKTVTASHKIGVNDTNKTYSDCGIVYAPQRPYILCVGSSGADKAKADGFISEISRTVYQYVINN